MKIKSVWIFGFFIHFLIRSPNFTNIRWVLMFLLLFKHLNFALALLQDSLLGGVRRIMPFTVILYSNQNCQGEALLSLYINCAASFCAPASPDVDFTAPLLLGVFFRDNHIPFFRLKAGKEPSFWSSYFATWIQPLTY